jgi:hypothetical protein
VVILTKGAALRKTPRGTPVANPVVNTSRGLTPQQAIVEMDRTPTVFFFRWLMDISTGAGGGGGAVDTDELVIGFVINSGAPGTNVGPMLAAPRAGSLVQCVVTTKASDATAALTFTIRQNGTPVFSTPPTVAAGTAAGTVSTFTALSPNPLPVSELDVFSIDITAGAAAWQFTAQLEGAGSGGGGGGGGVATSILPIRTVAANTTMTTADYTVVATVPSITITLPSSPATGQIFNVKNGNIIVGQLITVTTTGGVLIDQASSLNLGATGSLQVQFDGTQYRIL